MPGPSCSRAAHPDQEPRHVHRRRALVASLRLMRAAVGERQWAVCRAVPTAAGAAIRGPAVRGAGRRRRSHHAAGRAPPQQFCPLTWSALHHAVGPARRPLRLRARLPGSGGALGRAPSSPGGRLRRACGRGSGARHCAGAHCRLACATQQFATHCSCSALQHAKLCCALVLACPMAAHPFACLHHAAYTCAVQEKPDGQN